ncbi:MULTISPECIES: hypothetical protein [unclassified Halomonas]|uniref:hypothetical protein n=1 Tax=unclassified Halomonas TaxID=2609666 RepID=UPI0009C3A8F7|nr:MULTISPECIES: hypothetical protein [unclassified Halomonas]AQU85177.1 hypothetical protein B2G49_11635 [Halomonas sp. 'Soap Lake \
MEDALKRLLQIVVELLKFIVMALVVQILFFNLGRFSLWLLTIGRYPRGALAQQEVSWITFAGFITFVVFVVAMGFYNSASGMP